MATLIVPRAHAAAVTALEILDASRPGLVTVATTSLDQQIKIWDLHIESTMPGVNGITVDRACKSFTSVADISSMALLEHQSEKCKLIVCGVGIDVWRYGNGKNE